MTPCKDNGMTYVYSETSVKGSIACWMGLKTQNPDGLMPNRTWHLDCDYVVVFEHKNGNHWVCWVISLKDQQIWCFNSLQVQSHAL